MYSRAGEPAEAQDLVDVSALLHAFIEVQPDVASAAQRVSFGTSGHRGTSTSGSFNRAHIVAICTAIAEYRHSANITGPLFLGADPHPLSAPAEQVAAETFAAQGVRVLRSAGTGNGFFVPTPALSHAVLTHNRNLDANDAGRADGVILTPSHNPPGDGGIKYNPPHGGPADTDVTQRIAGRANELLSAANKGDGSMSDSAAAVTPDAAAGATSATAEFSVATDTYDFLGEYVASLDQIIDFAAIREAGVRIGAHPLGGASTAYWSAIRDTYQIDLTVLGPGIDPRWGFMTLDWDGKIRMDPSSKWAMQTVVEYQDDFDLVTGNDADADRHGIVTRDGGLMNPNHFLAVAIDYLLTHRPGWASTMGVGKTLVSSAIIDRVVAAHGRTLVEVPVGFKWFVEGLLSGELAFGGEESAGASFQRFDGSAWSTDKDGIVLALLAAEILAVTGQTPSERYRDLTAVHGDPAYARSDAAANREERAALAALDASVVTETELGGDPIVAVMTETEAGQPIGGIKVQTEHAWFAARPSGTEDVMKIYAESFRGADHLQLVQAEARALVARALG